MCYRTCDLLHVLQDEFKASAGSGTHSMKLLRNTGECNYSQETCWALNSIARGCVQEDCQCTIVCHCHVAGAHNSQSCAPTIPHDALAQESEGLTLRDYLHMHTSRQGWYQGKTRRCWQPIDREDVSTHVGFPWAYSTNRNKVWLILTETGLNNPKYWQERIEAIFKSRHLHEKQIGPDSRGCQIVHALSSLDGTALGASSLLDLTIRIPIRNHDANMIIAKLVEATRIC